VSGTLVVNEIYLSLQGESTFAGLPCVFVRLTACNLRCSYCDSAYAFSEGRKMLVADVLAEVRRLSAPFRPDRGWSPAAADPRIERPGNVPETMVQPPAPRAATARAPQSETGAPGSGLRNPPSEINPLPLVELTGGEPLLQPGALPLMKALCDEGFAVLLETSGAHDVAPVDARVHRIMDLKCPSSGEVQRNRWDNLSHLNAGDEIKFVIGTREDYDWAREQIAARGLAAICPLLFSWVQPLAAEQQHPSLKPVPPGQTTLTRLELAERIIADALPVRFQVQLHKVIWPAEKRGV